MSDFERVYELNKSNNPEYLTPKYSRPDMVEIKTVNHESIFLEWNSPIYQMQDFEGAIILHPIMVQDLKIADNFLYGNYYYMVQEIIVHS